MLLQIVLESALLPLFGVFPSIMKTFGETLAMLPTIGFHQGVLTYWMALGLHFGLLFYRRYRNRKHGGREETTESHLELLPKL